MHIRELLNIYGTSPTIEQLAADLKIGGKFRLQHNTGSVTSILVSAMMKARPGLRVVVLDDRESAAYFYNDIMALTEGNSVAYLPSSYRRSLEAEEKDNESILERTEVLDRLKKGEISMLVTYPEGLAERVVDKKVLDNLSMTMNRGDKISVSFVENLLMEYGFERSDFVYEPGQFSIRGSIIDVFSFAEEKPIRIDFFGDEVDSIRFFNVETQLSEERCERVSIVPDLSNKETVESYTDLFEYFTEKPVWWLYNGNTMRERIIDAQTRTIPGLLTECSDLFTYIESCSVVEWGLDTCFKGTKIDVECELQPMVNKHFDMLADIFRTKIVGGYKIYVCSNNEKQVERLHDIFTDKGYKVKFISVSGVVHEGFIDNRLKICVFTEHQIFDRYHKYQLRSTAIHKGRESVSLSELQNLHPGDYVVHIDHGVGRFGGLVKLNNNGKEQEAIRLVYKNNSELYVGLHSLHKISKYKGKDGVPPTVNKLGGDGWSRLKQKTKARVKDIARELIALYAKRKKVTAFAFGRDSFLQEEMEASFEYDETPDQMKAIEAVKADMEQPQAMDRLVCGDVGFGKTEVAIRAAFKAVADSKQVAVLVPTTVLAFQHYNTFCKRLKDMPCRVEYVSRMRKPAEVRQIFKDLKEGKVDIVIGTHRLTGKDVQFKDLGLLIIDEEQKFGVAIKEKLRQMKTNIDTLTMSATPIPRTLQFSLMGARDMSIIRTPPMNRYPIVTELHRFDDQVIRDAIMYEVTRGGQVFFIHNRVDTIRDIEVMLHRIVPQIKTCVAHGQMSGEQMENVMHDFMRGDYDVLVATTIVESGLDISNANTIIINEAQNYGLSDLHQLRGRVGRSNKKAFCYLLTPPLEMVNPDARRRLKAIEDFSGLGSGFNIAMQDLDIRGAGNILGAEQSGFIAEIGYETYQRILNEAMLELRDEEFPDLKMSETDETKTYVMECVIDSDFELLIPESYVESISERIRLYRELDNIEDEESLSKFAAEIEDRFGAIPEEVKGLMKVVRMRRKCLAMGMERLTAKGGKMIIYFVSDQQSVFYSSPLFTGLLTFVQRQVLPCRMNEKNDKLSLVFEDVKSVDVMENVINQMYNRLLVTE